jgi:broad specificity phosphatase PhoE
VILLARHGESVDNAPPARIQGRRDPPLSELGREQARVLAEEVAGEGLAALYASQMRRARETAGIVAARIGLEPRVDERLAEVDMGEWQGRVRSELMREHPEVWEAWGRADPAIRFPGGESIAELSERVLAALADIAAGPLPALVVCHGGPIRVALGAAHGADNVQADIANTELFRLDPTALTTG